MSVLIVAEHDGKRLGAATQRVVTAGAQLGDAVDMAVLGGTESLVIAEQAAALQGINRVLHIADEAYAHQLAEATAERLADLVRDEAYTAVVAAASSFGKDTLPRVAALLDVAMVSEAIAIDGPQTFTRPVYAGNALPQVRCTEPVRVVTVRPTAFAPAPEQQSPAPIESRDPGSHSFGTELIEDALSSSDRPDLGSARVVVAGGRGLGSEDAFVELESLTDALGGALGASRAAVDAGFIPNEYQIGQTGKVVAPELYIGIGISGAIQHMAGIKDSKIIVAINKDEEAPIFQVADYGLVGDLFELIPQLREAIEKARA